MKTMQEQPCPKCKAYHGVSPLEHLKPEDDCGFDPDRPCKFCGRPVYALSTGGPEVCPVCEACGIEKSLQMLAAERLAGVQEPLLVGE